MKLLGKLTLCFLFLLLNLQAATIKISNSEIIPGEAVRFEIIASGKNVEFPTITTIASHEVQQAGSGIKTVNINGKESIEKTQSYVFFPTEDVQIPSFVVKVDGKEESTQAKQIKVVSIEQINKKLPYILELRVSDKNPFIGQMIQLDVILKLNERLDIGKIEALQIRGIENFTQNNETTQENTNQNGYQIIKLSSLITPQKEGNLTLQGDIRLGFASGNSFFTLGYDYKIARSLPITLEVKALPKGVKFAGDFFMEVTSDKQEVEAGKPVNVSVKIEGKGTLEDLESLKPQIDNVIIYEDKAKLKIENVNGVAKSIWTQKMALIASQDFTIPPFSLTFFDTKSKQVKSIKSEAIAIKIKGDIQKKSEISQATKKEIIFKKEGINAYYLLPTFLIGLLLGLMLSRIKFKKNTKNFFKNDKDFLQNLLQFLGQNKELDMWIKKLEGNLYENKNEKIDKKQIEKIVKNLKNKIS